MSKTTRVRVITKVWVLSLPGSVTWCQIAFLGGHFCIYCLDDPQGPFWLADAMIHLRRKSCVHTAVSEEGTVLPADKYPESFCRPPEEIYTLLL